MSSWSKTQMLVVGPAILRELGFEAGDEVRLEVVNEAARILRKPAGTEAWTCLWSGLVDDLRPVKRGVRFADASDCRIDDFESSW